MNTTIHTVGLLGCGLVGTAIAGRLTRAGFALAAHDIDAARRQPVEQAGGRWHSDIDDVVREATVLLLALPDTAATEAAFESIVRSGLALPPIVIDFGTDDPERIAALGERLATRGCAFIDAPLSGSSEQIAAGDAVMMIGGSTSAIDRAGALLEAIAARRFILGDCGSGARAKLATNLVLGLNRAALAEGFAFAESLGIDLKMFLALVRATPANSAAADVKGEKMLHGDYRAQSRIRQHRKDVALILELAQRSGQGLPLTHAHKGLLDAAVAAGDGDRDNAAILEEFRRMRRQPQQPLVQEKPV
jgi:3-hydroxyisobutyrate dehydrogenase-like beta-hydroxyacid dehydrogenase